MGLKAKIKDLAKAIVGPRFMTERLVRQELEIGEPELALLPIVCHPTKSFLDIGANQGVYSLYAERFTDRVIAIEANPDMAEKLRKVLKKSTQIHPVAMSDQSGSAMLMVPYLKGKEVHSRASLQKDANPGFDLKEVAVDISTVDSLNLKDVGAVKIDVEGHELAVLLGARETIARCCPVMIVECEERHNRGAVARMKAFFSELSYDMYFIHKGVLRDGSEFDVETLQRQEMSKSVDATVRAGDYINNFIFVHTADVDALQTIRAQVAKA